jgi:hypothetical protein
VLCEDLRSERGIPCEQLLHKTSSDTPACRRSGKHLESKGGWRLGKAVQAIPGAAGTLHQTKLFSRAYRCHPSCRLRGVFYAAGGARLGPGVRRVPPSAKAFSRVGGPSTKPGVRTETAWNKDVGADARGTARTTWRCDTHRSCPAGSGFVTNETGSACLAIAHCSAALARVPPVMHSAYSPKRTATNESRKVAEFRRAMRVPAGSCTRVTLIASHT